MGDQELTDLSYLRELAMGDEDIVIETMETFLEDTPKAIEEIKSFYDKADWEGLWKRAHKIKPNLSYMGMERARELIIDIEEQAKNEQISDGMGEQIAELEEVCRRSFEELSVKLEKLNS